MAKKTTRKSSEKTPKQPPKGYIGAGDDLLYDMENAGPDKDQKVHQINADGTITVFPASELSDEEWRNA